MVVVVFGPSLMKTDRGHFRVHFVNTVKFAVSTLVRVFMGTHWCILHRKTSSFMVIFVDIFVYTPVCIFVRTLVGEFMGEFRGSRALCFSDLDPQLWLRGSLSFRVF